ncbi:MAG TPA: AmmeMemoRadiSam system protein B [Candidatus Sulfotelmatobacter sp.]|nr:AmmeMemoRadiSam system protein B [Candidatus Sulfotelmatobacter sp.]
MQRRPAVAGTFYAGTPEALRRQLDALLPRARRPEPAVGLVAPHAGYVYSGAVAAAVYGRIAVPERCVIFGPNHTGLGAAVAIMTEGEWVTPLGGVPLDRELGQRILAHAPCMVEDPLGHQREHAIEVQLPFLQALGRPFRFVPISLLAHDLATCREVAGAVADAVQEQGGGTLLVASTDMSHYVSRASAQAKDGLAIDAMLGLDPERLHAVVRREGISMCGYHAVTTMLLAARRLGAHSAELVRYGDSGEVAGDTEEVVAYAGLLVR